MLTEKTYLKMIACEKMFASLRRPMENVSNVSTLTVGLNSSGESFTWTRLEFESIGRIN